MTTAPVWIIGASRSAARRLVATINMPCSIVRPKNTNESAASTVIAWPAMARGMPVTRSADTRGKRDAGIPLRPTANSANSVRSPHRRPADSTRVATGSGPSTKTSRRFGNSVSHITTDTMPSAPQDSRRKSASSLHNARSTSCGRKWRMKLDLTRSCANGSIAGAARNAAAQIPAEACTPAGMRSLCRNPPNVARAIIAICCRSPFRVVVMNVQLRMAVRISWATPSTSARTTSARNASSSDAASSVRRSSLTEFCATTRPSCRIST